MTEPDDADLIAARERAKNFLVAYEDYLTKDWGERCSEPMPGCHCCDQWALYDQAKSKLEFAFGPIHV